MMERVCKKEFLRWYKEEFLVSIEGKVLLGKAFMDKYFPTIQDPVTRNWTIDASAYCRIVSTYVEKRIEER